MHKNPEPRLNVLVLSSLFPDASRPHLAPFVVRQTQGLAAFPDIRVQVVAPLPLPPFPLCRHPAYAPRLDLPFREAWAGLDVIRPRFNPWPLTGGRFAARSLARALAPVLTKLRRDFRFDIIAAEYFYPDGPAAIAMGNKFQVPVSIKARGADIHFWGARRTTSQQVLEAGKAAHGLLCVSEALRADMISLGMPSDGIWCHYTGVDLRHFAPADRSAVKAALGVDRPLIVSVGALIPRKGQSLLLEAVTEVPDAQLVLVGDGPDRASLLSQARELGIAARVRLTGNLGQPDVARWLAAADVMALPSRSEGLANVWLEALASGTPIVICPAGGAQEVLTDTLAGRIVPRCPKKIATALREILSNPPATSTCRAVAEKFSWSRNAETLRDHLLLLSGK